MSRRPRLRAHLQPQRLAGGLLQLGSDPADALLLEGLSDTDAELVELLDGRLDLDELRRRPGLVGVPAGRVTQLVALLDGLGVLTDAPPRRAAVAVTGDPALAPALADVLTWCGLTPTEEVPEVTVLVDTLGAAGDVPAGTTCLPVQLGWRRVVIGPLVPAVQGPDDPCPSCLPAPGLWPLPRARVPQHVLLAAGALVAAHLVPFLEGEALPVGVTHDIDLTIPSATQRVWRRDPRCPACGRRATAGARCG